MRTLERGTLANMVRTAPNNLAALKKPFSPRIYLALSLAVILVPTLVVLLFSGQVLAQDYYGNQPRTLDPERAERDYIIPENDPYLAPQQKISPRQQYCRQLEQRLARDWINKNRGTEDLPRIRDEMRKARQIYKRLERRAERKNCYEYFLFSKSVRRTRRCIAMHKKIQVAQRKLSALEAQHQRIGSARQGGNFQRNELISSLARNGCGRQYKQAARKNSWGIFDFLNDDDARVDPRGRLTRHHMPFATYRTMCVRLCDGYYYPVSFSAMQSKFGQDNNTCQSKCAAPAKLFVYENPGGSVETMTSMDGIAYSELPNAWRYRKTFIKGCSCKLADYDPNAIQNFERGLVGNDKKAGDNTNHSAFNAPNIGNAARSVTAKPGEAAPTPEKPALKKLKTQKLDDATADAEADAIAEKLAQSELTAPKPVQQTSPR